MSSFASLMALSATHTRAAQSHAEAILEDRKKREAETRKKQLEKEKREKELAARLRLKHFEEQKKEEERKKRKEEEQKAAEAALERRKAAERDALLYGPGHRKGGSYKGSVSSASSSSQPRRKPLGAATDDDDDNGPTAEPLTREELRERKLQATLKRQFTSAKRSTTTGGYQRHGRSLPGGAVDVTTNGLPASSSSGKQSVKARLTAMPNTLTKLNTVKRDTRTIDEILQDRAKAKELKTLDGDDALAFDDWFGERKKEKSRPASAEGTPKPVSRAIGTPPVQSVPKKLPPASNKPSRSAPIPKSSASSSRPLPRPTGKPKGSSQPHPSSARKRERSPGAPESRAKRRALSSEEPDDGPLDVSGLIWDIMGKNRSQYVNMDVFSDDEDMEVDASALEREEKRSARIAREEELAALEEEKRHEEEKRRRRMRT